MKITNQFDRRDDRAFAAASQQSALQWLAALLAGAASGSGSGAQYSCIMTGDLPVPEKCMRFLHGSHSASHLPEAEGTIYIPDS
ncbi:hypothetical protein [Martelella radicis]|uniref:Uncharacterized protein n=1 Tax=Martelella radicis TaxID=1397476 RepID=A0A7W6PAL7_9HYPH|nr:hypothetical protein [Martelella radicis]MBB4123487.1 hypothetical protein [Martelella radicis]